MSRFHIIADTHTHTIASGHAYGTITENMAAAARAGLRFLACTDHTGSMSPVSGLWYFENLKVIPDEMSGVYLLRGCEANVLDASGALDIPDRTLAQLDWVIASMHPPVFPPQDSDAHTAAWLSVIQNPHVDVLGHCGDGRFPCDYEAVVRACADKGTIIEINSHSFFNRPGSDRICREVALLCKRFGTSIVVSSDAHFCSSIGAFDDALRMLEEIDFPEELILNADFDRFADAVKKRCPGERIFISAVQEAENRK